MALGFPVHILNYQNLLYIYTTLIPVRHINDNSVELYLPFPILVLLFLFLVYFIDYAITVVPIFPPFHPAPPTPGNPHTIVHCQRSCIGSLATPFPILYFAFPWLFCNYLLVVLSPLTSSPIPLDPPPFWKPSKCSLYQSFSLFFLFAGFIF